MGLFGKKKKQPPAVPAAVKVTMPANEAFGASAGEHKAAIDSDGFFKSSESKSVKGLKGIKQSVIDERIEQMEKELAERPEQQDYHAYDKNPVKEKELERASGEFESVCEQISEKQSKTRYKAIKEAITDDIDSKVEELANTYDYLSDESYTRNTADFNEVLDDERQRSENEKEMAFVEKLESRPSSMPSLTQLQMDLMVGFVESDIRAKPVDFPDDIPSMSATEINDLTAKFEEKYLDAQSSQQNGAGAEKPPQDDEQAELERLRKMFGFSEE